MTSFASFDGTVLVYAVHGPEDSRPPVILLHGFAADSEANWVRPGVVDALTSAGRRVVTVDARGHGRSEKPHEAEAYGGHAMVRDVQALIDHLGADRVDVCGYSMGAMTAYALAALEPRARSAVLGGVGSRLSGRALAERGPRIAEALLAEDPSAVSDPTAAAFRAFADSTGADRLALAAIQRSHRAAMPDAGAITLPVLVITGDKDTLVGSPHELAERIPGASVAVVSGDHLTAVFDPKFRAAIVDFLAGVDGRVSPARRR